jgi:E1-E2 ATPase/Cation transporting ATPase, C-terminus
MPGSYTSLTQERLSSITDWLYDHPQNLNELSKFEKSGGIPGLLENLRTHITRGKIDTLVTVQEAARRSKMSALLKSPLAFLYHSLPLLVSLINLMLQAESSVWLICVFHTGYIFLTQLRRYLETIEVHGDNVHSLAAKDTKVVVVRGGIDRSICWSDVILGDLVKIERFHTLMADGMLLHGIECIADETAILGPEMKGAIKLTYETWLNNIHELVEKSKQIKELPFPSPALLAGSTIMRGSGIMVVTAIDKDTKIERQRRKLSFYLEENFPQTRLGRNISNTLIVWKIGIAIVSGLGCLAIGKHRLAQYNSGQKSWSTEETKQVMKLLAFWLILPTFIKNLQFKFVCDEALERSANSLENVKVNDLDSFVGLTELHTICMDPSGILYEESPYLTTFWSHELYCVSEVGYMHPEEQSCYLHPEDLAFRKSHFLGFSQLFVNNLQEIASLCFSADIPKVDHTEERFESQSSLDELQFALESYMRASSESQIKFDDGGWHLVSWEESGSGNTRSFKLQKGQETLTILKGDVQEVIPKCESLVDLALEEQHDKAFSPDEVLSQLVELKNFGLKFYAVAYQKGFHLLSEGKFTCLGVAGLRPAVYPEAPIIIEDFYRGQNRILLASASIANPQNLKEQEFKDGYVKLIASSLMLLPDPEEPGFSIQGSKLYQICQGLVEYPYGFRVKNRTEFVNSVKDLVLVCECDQLTTELLITGFRNEEHRICRVERASVFKQQVYQPDLNIVISDSSDVSENELLIRPSILVRSRDLRLIHSVILAARNHREKLLKVLQYRITLWASISGIFLLSSAVTKETLFSIPYLIFTYWVFDVLPTRYMFREKSTKQVMHNPSFKPTGAFLITNVIYYIFGQIFFQTSLVIFLLYQGPKFLPDNISTDPSHFKEVNGNFLVRSGVGLLGWSKRNEDLPSRHFSYLLVIFFFMQIGSLINSRRIRGEINVLNNLIRSQLVFPLICMTFSTYLLATMGSTPLRMAAGGFCIRGWTICSIFSFSTITWSLVVKAVLGVHPT